MKWARRILVALAVAYPLALLAAAAMLRFVGERWWVSTVALYLPRIGFAVPLPFIAAGLRIFRMRRLLRLQAASAVLIVFPLMGFALPWPRSGGPGARLRVLSYNVNSGAGGAEAVVDQISRYSPDVVLLQEIGGNDAIGHLLQSRYPTVVASGQFVLATQYPLSSTVEPDKVPYDGRLRSPRFLRHVLETALGPIAFYNVHPISPREALFALRGEQGLRREIGSGHLLSGAAGPLIASNAGLRALQVQTFAEAAAGETGSVIIAGDTNLPDLSPVLHRFLSTYEDGFIRAGWGFGYTFPTNKWRPWMRIDRVFVNDRLHVVRFEVGRSTVSDHQCVVADVQRAEP